MTSKILLGLLVKIWKESGFKRAIFQTFWKPDCCTKSLFLELETSNFGYLLIFLFLLAVQSGRLQNQKTSKGSPLKDV